MAKKRDDLGRQFPLKRRTRGHVIADLSRVYTELVFVEAGYTLTPILPDYGDDLIVRYYDENGLIEPWISSIQLKASERFVHQNESEVRIDLEAKDIRHWLQTVWPTFLIAFEASTKILFYLDLQAYFSKSMIHTMSTTARTIRVTITKNNVANLEFAKYSASVAEKVYRRNLRWIEHDREIP